jgi:hypothetical protein
VERLNGRESGRAEIPEPGGLGPDSLHW